MVHRMAPLALLVVLFLPSAHAQQVIIEAEPSTLDFAESDKVEYTLRVMANSFCPEMQPLHIFLSRELNLVVEFPAREYNISWQRSPTAPFIDWELAINVTRKPEANQSFDERTVWSSSGMTCPAMQQQVAELHVVGPARFGLNNTDGTGGTDIAVPASPPKSLDTGSFLGQAFALAALVVVLGALVGRRMARK
jgi:hypothetical protein